MGLIDALVSQSGKPTGNLGRIMIKIMNKFDSGLNSWVIEKTNFQMGRVLEIGCGGGQTLNVLLRNSKINHIVGIDYSSDAVSVAIKKNKNSIQSGKMVILQENVESLPFSECYFDCILAVRSHYFWEDLEKSFTEIYRVLKPSGEMLIFSERYKIQYHMKRFQTDDSIRILLQTVGFRNISIENRKSVQCITAYR